MKYSRILFLGLACVASVLFSFPLHAEQNGSDVPRPPKLDLESSRPQRWAVLIGVDDYAEMDDQTYCVRDIKNLQSRLIAAGFPATNVFVLRDGAQESKYLPSKSNIERQLKLVPMLTGKNDLLLVVYCGHAVRVDGKDYLCPIEARPEAATKTLISMDHVYRWLAAARTTHKLLVIDAARNSPGGPDGTAWESLYPSEQPPPGIAVLTSCQKGQVSLVDEGLKQGVFMHFLLKGIEGQADEDGGNGDQRISLGELYDYARAKTARYAAEKKNSIQVPVLLGRIAKDVEIGSIPKYAPNAEAYPMIDSDLGTTSARLEAIVRITPQSLQSYNQALAAYGHCDIIEAIEYCTDAVRRDPGNTWAYILRATCYCSYGDFAKALKDYRQLGIPLPCHVSAATAQLKNDDKVTATVSRGDRLYVTKANGEWLWAESVGGDQIKKGWILKEHVE